MAVVSGDGIDGEAQAVMEPEDFLMEGRELADGALEFGVFFFFQQFFSGAFYVYVFHVFQDDCFF